MGMFDYIKCELPLPQTPKKPPGDTFQSKDTPDQFMTLYTITPDGRLSWRPYHMEEVPKAERPHPNADGLLGISGSIRRVESEPEFIEYHGDIDFYEWHEGTCWKYRARFTDGVCRFITLVYYEDPHHQALGDHT